MSNQKETVIVFLETGDTPNCNGCRVSFVDPAPQDILSRLLNSPDLASLKSCIGTGTRISPGKENIYQSFQKDTNSRVD
jgi:hypothetical protein